MIGLKFSATNINFLIVCSCALLFSFLALSFRELYLWNSLGFILTQVLYGLAGFYQVTMSLLAFLAVAYCLTPEKDLPALCLAPATLSLVNITWSAFWWAWPMPSGCSSGTWQQCVAAAVFFVSIVASIVALVIFRRRLPLAAALVLNSLWLGFLSFFVASMATTHTWI